MVWNGDNRCKWSLDAGSLIIYLFRGEGREKGWLGARQWYLVPGQNWPWSDPLLFSKNSNVSCEYIHFCQCVFSFLLAAWFVRFLRLSNVTFITVTRNGSFFYYLFQGYRGKRERSGERRIDIAGLIFVETKNTKYNGRYKFNSERWFQLLSLFFSFFFPSTLRVVEKEGRVQISSAATKRRNFVVRVNTDEPAALTSAPLSHFTLFIRLSATLSRPRPFIRPYFQSTDLLYSTYVSLRMHLANLGSRLTSYSKCRPHFSLPRLWLSRDFSRYWPRSLRLTGIDCSNRGNSAKFNPWTMLES